MSYSSAVLALAPTVYYQLQDSLSDNSGNGNAAMIRGASTAQPAYSTGIVDTSPRGLLFDGSNDYAYVPLITYGSNKVSLAFWVNFAALSGAQVILETTTNYGTTVPGVVGNATFLVYSDGTNIQIGVGMHISGSTNFETWTFPLPGTNDMHVAVVFDLTLTGSGRCKVYYDKVAQTASANTPRTETYNFYASDLYLMSRAGSSFFTGALFDDFAVWCGTALSSTNVTTIYDAAFPTVGAVPVRRRPRGLYIR